MSQIVDVSVWNTANKYQDAAKLLNTNNMKWVACINSALAIEIYLKSIRSDTPKGHDLESLYKNVSSSTKEMLIDEINKVTPNIELESKLRKYNGVFVNARYTFELESKSHLDTGIIHLADSLREALYNLGIKHNS